MTKNETCSGCKNRTSKRLGDGSCIYGCTVHYGVATGSSSALDGDHDAPRCDKYSSINVVGD